MAQNDFNVFLLKGKEVLKGLSTYACVYVVLGNETCDLDSAVSSLVYGYTLYMKDTPHKAVLSVLNIPHAHFPIKTEVLYYLKECNIDVNSLIFRDDVNLKDLQNQGKLKLILVDHHALNLDNEFLRTSVVEVIDHRPQDPVWAWKDTKISLQTVGSCCTLIAQNMINMNENCITSQIAKLLYGPIVLDTACFSECAGITTKHDYQVAAKLEGICGNQLDRKKIFRDLQEAKADISSLTPNQLLIKDMKITSGVPVIGLPISVKDFLKDQSAQEAVKSFCNDLSAPIGVIMGLTINNDVIKRDLAVYSDDLFPSHADQLMKQLKECKEPDLKLQPVSVTAVKSDFLLFDIGNIKASRKQVLPIIRKFGQQLRPQL